MAKSEICPFNPADHDHQRGDYLPIDYQSYTSGHIPFKIVDLVNGTGTEIAISQEPCIFREVSGSSNGFRAKTQMCSGCKKVLRVSKAI